MSHETCKQAKSGLIDLSLSSSAVIGSGSSSSGSEGSSSKSNHSNHQITLGCSKSLKVVTTTNSNSNNSSSGGSQFKYRLGKKSAPIAPAPIDVSQGGPSSSSPLGTKSTELFQHGKASQINIGAAVTHSSMAEKRSKSIQIESNSHTGMSKTRPWPSGSPSTTISTSDSNASSLASAPASATIATSHNSSHQRYINHDLHRHSNQSSNSFRLIRTTSSSSTTAATISSSRSINSTGSNHSNSSRRVIFQTVYESQRKITTTHQHTQISKNNQDQAQKIQIVDIPQSQPHPHQPSVLTPPPLPSIISQPSSPAPSESSTAMLMLMRKRSSNDDDAAAADDEAIVGTTSSYDCSLSTSSTLSQDEKKSHNRNTDLNNSGQNQYQDLNQEPAQEEETETHIISRKHSHLNDPKLIPLSSLDLRQLEIPPYSNTPRPNVSLSSCPSSPLTPSSLHSNSEEQGTDEHVTSVSPTSIISEKNNSKAKTALTPSKQEPFQNSILRKKNFLEILRDHIQNNPLLLSSKRSVEDNRRQKIGSSSSHCSKYDEKSINEQLPSTEMRSIASERVFRNQSLPVSQDYDKLSKTIHSISGSGIDLSILPRERNLKKQSSKSTLETYEKSRNAAPHHHHSATYPHYSNVSEINLRKSLSDSCLYSFQNVSTLGNDNDTIAKAPVGNMISPPAPSVPLSPQKLKTERRSSITSVNSYSSENSMSSISSISSTNHRRNGVRKVVNFSNNLTRHISHEEIGRNKIIRFDPRVWVHEIQCPPVDKIWYSAADMNRFKYEAILRIRKWSCKHHQVPSAASRTIISTGTGRIVNVENGVTSASTSTSSHMKTASSTSTRARTNNRVIYTNPALSCESEDEDEDDEDSVLANLLSMRETAMIYEFKSILIVDSHDIFLKLLSKGIKLLFPHIQIATACTVEQACKQIESANLLKKGSGEEIYSHGFDLIIVEERLKPHVQPRSNTGQQTWNGSSLIQKIKKEVYDMSMFNKYSKRYPLIIGISAYLNHDMEHLKASGSDFVWGKPPPKMDDNLRMEMLRKVMIKRNRPNVEEMFQQIRK